MTYCLKYLVLWSFVVLHSHIFYRHCKPRFFLEQVYGEHMTTHFMQFWSHINSSIILVTHL